MQFACSSESFPQSFVPDHQLLGSHGDVVREGESLPWSVCQIGYAHLTYDEQRTYEARGEFDRHDQSEAPPIWQECVLMIRNRLCFTKTPLLLLIEIQRDSRFSVLRRRLDDILPRSCGR